MKINDKVALTTQVNVFFHNPDFVFHPFQKFAALCEERVGHPKFKM